MINDGNNSRINEISTTQYLNRLHDELGRNHTKNCTSIRSVNKRLRNINGFTIIAGEPKTGKSTLAHQFAEEYAEEGIVCLYYDFEMGWRRFFKRSFQRHTGIVLDDEIEKSDQKTLIRTLNDFCSWYHDIISPYFYYRDSSKLASLSLNGSLLDDDINAINAIHDNPKIVVIIDSIQKLPISNLGDRRTSIDKWLRFIEHKIAQHGITVFAVSELSRAGNYKESGDIEYTADNCINLVYENPSEKQNDQLKLQLEYSRDYESGLICVVERQRPEWKFVEMYDADEYM